MRWILEENMAKSTRKIRAEKATAKRVVPAATAKPRVGGAPARADSARARAVAPEPKERKFRPKVSYTPTEAKKWLLEICNDVTRDGKKRAYVEDRQGDWV